jgi:hypothetical protein
MTHTYRVDTGKKDQGWTLLDEGSISLGLDKDGPATLDAMTLAAGEGDGTYQTLSKQSIRATTKANTRSLEVIIY